MSKEYSTEYMQQFIEDVKKGKYDAQRRMFRKLPVRNRIYRSYEFQKEKTSLHYRVANKIR